jgi:hypothetical protein
MDDLIGNGGEKGMKGAFAQFTPTECRARR